MTHAGARAKQVIRVLLKPVRWLRARLGFLFDIVVVGVALVLFGKYVPFGGQIITGFILLTGLVAVAGVAIAVLHRLGVLGGKQQEN